MEALIAVGLAGNVVSFVQFGREIIREANSIKKGGPSSIEELKRLATHITEQASHLKKRLKGGKATLHQEDQNLIDIAENCHAAGTQFISFLDALVPPSASSSLLGSWQASFKCHLEYPKIEDFVSKIEKLQNALCLATILALRTSSNANAEYILQSLKDVQQDVREETTQVLDRVETLVQTLQSQGMPDITAISTQIQDALERLQGLRDELPRDRENAILRWLWFRDMSARYDEVPEAYKATYEWVFQSPPPEYRWDDFKAHLTGQDIIKPYFIYGKPGCGKSTLMKFIALHKETESLLAQWAGKDELTVVKYFSWNVGTPLQKNQTGMLRTFMHTILKKHPELIPTAFPEIYNYWDFNKNPGDPTHVELASSFKRILEPLNAFSKILVILDGIDEFEGDHRALSEFIYSLPDAKAKVIVSSRPINASLGIFRDCPALRLQDLTKEDMRIYIREKLASHPTMEQIMKVHPKEHSEVVSELQEKAEGVFLWVKLVVGVMIKGMDAGDDIWQLQKKLRSLPNDLRDLYHRMFVKMPREYQVQAAKIFRLKETWKKVVLPLQDLCTLLLYFAVQPPSLELTEALLLKDLNYYHNTIVAQIRNHCCGFLEIHPNIEALPKANRKEGLRAYLVDVLYIHRTVHEFMVSEGLWNELLNLLPSEFDPSLSLASACLRIIRAVRLLRLEFDRDARDHMEAVFRLLREAIPPPRGALSSYVDTLDEEMTLLQKTYSEENIIKIHPGEHWTRSFEYPTAALGKWSQENPEYQVVQQFNTASLAAETGFTGYLETYFNENPEIDSLQKLNLVMASVDGMETASLQFVLQHIDQSKETCCGRKFLKITLDYTIWLQNEGYTHGQSHEKAVRIGSILCCFIATSSAPENAIREYRSLVSDPDLNLSGKDLAILDLPTMIKKLKEHEVARVRALGDQIEAALQKCEEQDREEKKRQEQKREEKEREVLGLKKQRRKKLMRNPRIWFRRKGKPDHTSVNNNQEPEEGICSSLRRLKLVKRT